MKSFKELTEDVINWNNLARVIPPTEEQQEAIVRSEIQEHFDAVKEINFVEELDAVADIFFTNEYMKYLYPNNMVCQEADDIVLEAISLYGVCTVIKVIEEVVRSNFTKFVPKVWVEALEYTYENEVSKLEKESGLSIKAKFIGDYIIFVDENNKVRKPASYEPPNIKAIVYELTKKVEGD